MAQSKSTNEEIQAPKRKFNIEILTGIFTLIAFVAIAYLSINIGGMEISSSKYKIYEAEFNNVSGLQNGANVEIAGVPIGQVLNISLEDPLAIIKLKINKDITLKDDDILSVRTKGIIGDKYLKITRGGSDFEIAEGDRIIETESVVDIEDLIGKFVHSYGSEE